MKVEIPKFERCCCCLPLRRGILTFAYLNLFITIFFGALQVSLWVYFYPSMKFQASMVAMYRGVVIEAQMFFVITLHVLDVVFNIILIVGAHMKNARLMRWYYFYQLTMMIANFFAMLVTYTDISKVGGGGTSLPSLSEYAIAFIGFVVQIYLLLLVHSELNKLRYQERRSSFINHMTEVFIEHPYRHDRRTLL